MRALVADDDRVGTAMLMRALRKWDFEVSVAPDGEAAWDLIQAEAPQLAILDWMMPRLDGLELCRRIRQDPARAHMYLILLTARHSKEDMLAGLEAGADDFLVKPFDPEELRARMHVGVRVVTLQEKLADRVTELEAAIATVKQLRGLIPICSYCKRIRSDKDDWEQMETYISEHSDAEFSHGICPSCLIAAEAEFSR